MAPERRPLSEASATRVARRLSLARLAEARRRARAVARDPGPEAIHDLRVALRRLRAAVELFDGPQALDAELKAISAALGVCRDAQLRLEWLSRPGLPRAAADALRAQEEKRLGKALPSAMAAASRWQGARWRLFERKLNRLELRGRFDGHRLHGRLETLADRVDVQTDRLRQSGTARQVHKLRIRVKKLRYATELLRTSRPRSFEGLIGSLGELQTLLGELRDAQMRSVWLDRALDERGRRPSRLVRRAREEELQRAKRLARFLAGRWTGAGLLFRR